MLARGENLVASIRVWQLPSGDGEGAYMLPLRLGGIKNLIKRLDDEERRKNQIAESHTGE